ncbi:MAG: hypothetical protein MJ176_10640 [Treponema sp.]|nr:hypothetical protein [Treponema sp.]
MKKGLLQKFKIIIVLALGFFAISCKQNVTTMLDAYNGLFEGVSDVILPVPGDPDFDPDTMLNKYYAIPNYTTFNECAPPAYTWTWTLYERDGTTVPRSPNAPFGYGRTAARVNYDSRNTQMFSLYIPTSNLKIGVTYELELRVSDKQGNVYTDVAEFVIFESSYIN